MSLSKGATFHVPSSPPTEDSPVLSIPHLARRSPTCSQSSLISLLFEKEDGAARSIQDFERTFSGARGRQRAHRRSTDQSSGRRADYFPACSPTDEGLGSSISTPTDKDLTRVFERALDLDSGLGSSITSESAKEARVRAEDDTSEEDGLSVGDLIQGWIARCILMSFGAIDTHIAGVVNKAPHTRQRSLASEAQSAIVRSISPMIPCTAQPPHLSNFARKKFAELIYQPILREDRFKCFHPLVSALGSRTNKTIKCLRDLEQSLIFEPLVSTILELNNNTNTYTSSSISKRLTIPHTLYRSFGEFSVQLVLDTFHHLSEPQQRRAADRPYDSGYFLDLVQQVERLAAQVGAARRAPSGAVTGEADADEMDFLAYVCTVSPGVYPISHHHRNSEITLEGSISQTGHLAEIVRWKDGKGVSLRTDGPYHAPPAVKRQRSNESLDDEAERSMARRKKNAEPKITELRCSDRSCDKIFNRKCDLAKHEKTHSRPYKCDIETCKYHDQGLPTEKELERHVNDKHASSPKFFHCKFCPFKTKRDSNCKQHMEKKHNWNYQRVKGNAKSARTPQQTPQTPNMSTPSVSDDYENTSPNWSEGGSNFTPYTTSVDDICDTMPQPRNAPYNVSLFPTNPLPPNGPYGYDSPELNFNVSPFLPNCPAPATRSVDLTSTYGNGPSYFDGSLTQAYPNGPAFNVTPSNPLHIGLNYHDDFPGMSSNAGGHSLQPQSRNPSISEISPMVTEEDAFHPPQQMIHPGNSDMSTNYTGMADLPNDDFPLFGVSDTPSMVPSTADVSSYDAMEFFGNMETEYSDSQLEHYVNL
jgi:hypothetical protein